MITTLIYDLDGTLVEFKLDIAGMKETMVKMLSDQGVPRRYLRLDDPIRVLFGNSWKFLQGIGWPRDRFDQMINNVLKAIEPYEIEAAKTTSLQDGVIEVLDHFRIERKTQAVLTNVPGYIAKMTLDRFRLVNYFTRIMGRDEMSDLKPDPRGMGTLLRRLKVSPDQVLMIGDSILDVLAAKANHVRTIGIASGISRKQELQEAGAFQVLDEISELPPLFAELQKEEK